MTRMKALLALAAIAVAVIAGLKMSLPPVGRPCAGCGYPPGQGHNDRCPRRHAPLPEGDDGEVECYMHPDDGHHYMLVGASSMYWPTHRPARVAALPGSVVG
jgi:hypothetical protein